MNPSCHPKAYDNHAVHEPHGYFFVSMRLYVMNGGPIAGSVKILSQIHFIRQ